jgi:hypothetical protein
MPNPKQLINAGPSIKTAYESQEDTNAFTDAEKAQVATISQKAGKVLVLGLEEDDFTLALSDANTHIEIDGAAEITVTVPADASVNFPLGTQIGFSQMGAGQISFEAAVGVTILSAETLKTAKQYAGAGIYKSAVNVWVLFGNLEPA